MKSTIAKDELPEILEPFLPQFMGNWGFRTIMGMVDSQKGRHFRLGQEAPKGWGGGKTHKMHGTYFIFLAMTGLKVCKNGGISCLEGNGIGPVNILERIQQLFNPLGISDFDK